LVVEQNIELAARNNSQLAVIFIDLDHFKKVNDTLGHDLGDELLKSVAENLRDHLRESDMLARIGGDVLSSAKEISEKYLYLLNRSFMISGYETNISASIGISIFPTDGQDTTTLVKNADTAMYHAKTHGRNTYHFFSHEMSEHVQERVRIERLLRRSIERNELSVHYQPQVDFVTGQLVSASYQLLVNRC